MWDFLAAGDPSFALRFELGWEQLVGDILPFVLCETQMPPEL